MLPLSSRKDTGRHQQSEYFIPSWVCGLSRGRCCCIARSQITQHIQPFQSYILWISRFPARNVQYKCGSHSLEYSSSKCMWQVKHSDELCLDIREGGSEEEALESCFPTLMQFSDQKSVRVNSAANPTLSLQAPRKAGVLCHTFPCVGSGRDWAGKVLRQCSFSVSWRLVGSEHQNISRLALTERWKTQEYVHSILPLPVHPPSGLSASQSSAHLQAGEQHRAKIHLFLHSSTWNKAPRASRWEYLDCIATRQNLSFYLGKRNHISACCSFWLLLQGLLLFTSANSSLEWTHLSLVLLPACAHLSIPLVWAL